jgi:hypothetical protein
VQARAIGRDELERIVGLELILNDGVSSVLIGQDEIRARSLVICGEQQRGIGDYDKLGVRLRNDD